MPRSNHGFQASLLVATRPRVEQRRIPERQWIAIDVLYPDLPVSES